MTTVFLWAWNNYEPQPDKGMTRGRAAKLLVAWRRTSRRTTSHCYMMRKLERLGRGVYKVTDSASGETGTMHIIRAVSRGGQ